MIADELYAVINDKYPNRFVRISVVQDNENGCEMDLSNQSESLKEDFVAEDTGC